MAKALNTSYVTSGTHPRFDLHLFHLRRDSIFVDQPSGFIVIRECADKKIAISRFDVVVVQQ